MQRLSAKLFLSLFSCNLFFAMTPQVVQAQSSAVPDANVKLTPERPEIAPQYASPPPVMAPEQPSYAPFHDYTNDYVYRNQQYGYGQPYTRPGYYPSGSPDYDPPANYPQYEQPQQPVFYRGAASYVPQGLVIPIDLRTAISTQVAKQGDFIEATVNQNLPLNGPTYLPAGTVMSGEITEARAGRRLSRSGSLSVELNNLRLPNGSSFPISAHLVGTIGRYKD